MVGTVSRLTLVVASLIGFTGLVAARDGATSDRARPKHAMKGFKPSYQATTNVAGPERPYTWPVSERYRPVSQPYFGRSY